jgi:hypothetical protein
MEKQPINPNDPVVLSFLEYLGLNPMDLIKIIITIEVSKPIIVEETHRAIRKQDNAISQ